MANNYWQERHQILVEKYLEATTEKDRVRIYYKLLPQLRLLINNIRQKFFSIPEPQHEMLINECLTEILLKINKYDKTKQKAFSFFSMVVKHYIFDEYVRKKDMAKQPKIHYIEGENSEGESDEYYSLDSYSNEDAIDYFESEEIDFEMVNKYFDKKIKYIDKKIKALDKKDAYYRYRFPRLTAEKQAMNLCKEFIDRYQSFNVNYMAEYVFLNLKFFKRETDVVNLFKKFLNLNVTIHRDNTKSTINKTYNLSNDDYTPDIDVHDKRVYKNKKGMYKNNYEYI